MFTSVTLQPSLMLIYVQSCTMCVHVEGQGAPAPPPPTLIWNKVDQLAAMFESQFRKNHFTVYRFKLHFFTFMFHLGVKEMKNNSTR